MSPASQNTSKRTSIVLPVAVIGFLAVGGAIAYNVLQSSSPPAAAPVTTTTPEQSPAAPPVAPQQKPADAAAPVEVAKPASAPPIHAAARERAPDMDPKQLMTLLTGIDPKAPLSPEDFKKWKEALQQLIRQGPSSVAAIREFLAQNQDVSFAGAQGADQLGFSSLRAALLNALGQIGGQESTAAMLQTLQTSVFPADLASLATILQQQAPGQYNSDILAAVRTQMTAAAQDQLGNANVGPLFQLLGAAAANGTDATADLTQYGDKWPYYAAIELANLPNGAGVASLAQMAQNGGGAQSAAVESLAQLAPNNPQALNTLLSLASQGQVPDNILAQLAPYLGGRENQIDPSGNPPGTPMQSLHVANGNEDFTAADFNAILTQAQINQRISIIDQLVQSLPAGDTSSLSALQQQKGALSGRLGK